MLDRSSSRRRPFQFSLRQLLLVVTGCAALLSAGVLLFRRPPRPPDWRYEGQLHKAIAGADRIVVREGGFAWSGTGPQYRVLFEVTDPVEIKAVFDHLEFQTGQYAAVCGRASGLFNGWWGAALPRPRFGRPAGWVLL